MSLLRRRGMYATGELPSGYRRCKYLRGTGTEQPYTGAYIDTGIQSTSNTKVEIVVKKGILRYWDRFYGINNRAATPPQKGVWIMRNNNFEGHQCFANGKNIGTISLGYDVHTVTFDGGSVYVDGKLKLIYNGADFATTDSAWLFAVNGGDIRCDDYIYSCKIWHFGELVRNFVPCVDMSNVPCMYDTVSKQPFYNAGTGEFGYELMDGTYVEPA